MVRPSKRSLILKAQLHQSSDTYARESQTFLIDAPCYPGNSGGPVITKPVDTSSHIAGTKNSNKSALVGMVSQYLE